MIQTKKNIVLIGGGGHCKSCIEIIQSTEKYNIVGVLDLLSEVGKEVLKNIKVIGTDNDIEKYHKEGNSFIITIGQIKVASLRRKLFEQLDELGAEIETIVASTAYVSSNAKLGRGNIIMHHAFINVGVVIGDNNIINTGAIIEHDVKINNHNHISTNAVINGNCTIGKEVFIGSASCVSNNVSIDNQVVIGAGSLVLKNVEKQGQYYGNPIK